MEQYIPKSALVADLEKLRKNYWESFHKGNSTEEQYYIRYGVIQEIFSFINTLEVKEVDLNAAVEHYVEQHKSELNGYFDIRRIAKHFFELGLKVQKEE